MASVKHWTEETFIENPLLFIPELLGRLEKAEEEARQLKSIFGELGVPESGLVLDLACGIGRHSTALAKHGFRVVGVDISPAYIAKAEELAAVERLSGSCSFVHGDMRRLKDILGGHRFDAAICMFTSLGYYDAETDRDVLTQVKELTERGVLVVEMMNRSYAENSLTRKKYSMVGEMLRLEESFFDEEASRLRAVWRLYRPRGQDLEYVGSIRFDNMLYTRREFVELAASAGWENNEVYGGLDRSEFKEDSKKAVLIAW
ncbi:MAG TPA: class I SAM-dependent methyltransferase [Candidatus Krumholzibacteriaceae bacterium]|nr:class I SAM-dependent methyltransferase [Candidatus Krumholzibacteriaceae bacterium]